VITFHYPLWNYECDLNPIIPDISDNLGVYLVVTYLFIQWLPKKQIFFNLFRYFFIWTAITISIEWIHVSMGHLHYGLFWNMGWSYIADWILFGIFYCFYKIVHP